MRAVRPTQAQPIKLQYFLEMSEEDLDLLAILARFSIGVGVAERPGDVAGGFMDAARDLSRRGVRRAARFEHAALAVGLARGSRC